MLDAPFDLRGESRAAIARDLDPGPDPYRSKAQRSSPCMKCSKFQARGFQTQNSELTTQNSELLSTLQPCSFSPIRESHPRPVNAKMPCNRAKGVGGQPGMLRSTGMTLATAPQEA